MKHSVFTNKYHHQGKNGTFEGEVKVTLNYSTKPITGTHPATHDDFSKNISIHKVESFVNGELYRKVEDIESEEKVLFETQKVKNELVGRLQTLATEEPVETFTDKLNKILGVFS
jgi:hypothetical protein